MHRLGDSAGLLPRRNWLTVESHDRDVGCGQRDRLTAREADPAGPGPRAGALIDLVRAGVEVPMEVSRQEYRCLRQARVREGQPGADAADDERDSTRDDHDHCGAQPRPDTGCRFSGHHVIVLSVGKGRRTTEITCFALVFRACARTMTQ